MKKYVFGALAITILLAITGCNSNGNTKEELLTAVTQYNTIPALQPHIDTIYSPTQMLPYSVDDAYGGLVEVYTDDDKDTDIVCTDSVIFDKAAGWIAEGVPPPGDRELMHREMYEVELDGLGAQGLLAIRYQGRREWPCRYARIFYLYDGNVAYKDIGNVEGVPFSLAFINENRLIIFGGDGGVALHILFGMEYGRLIYDFTVYRHMRGVYYYNGYWHSYYNYYLIPGGIGGYFLENWESRVSLNTREYHETMEKYNLYNLTWPQYCE